MATGTPITLDKPRTLRFTIDAMSRFERETGMGIDEFWQRKQRIALLIELLYYGLQHEDASLTRARVVKLLDRYVTAGGDTTELNERVLEELFRSGVYGRDMAARAVALRAEVEEEGAAAADPPPAPVADA